MNRSPSWRLSDRAGLKRALRSVLSSSEKTDTALLRLDQKALLMVMCVSSPTALSPAHWPAAIDGVTCATSEGVDSSKSSRLRSTPFGPRLGAALEGRIPLKVCTDFARVTAPCGATADMASMVLLAGSAWGWTAKPPAMSAVALAAPNLIMLSTLASMAAPALIFASMCAWMGAAPIPVPPVTREAPNSVTCSRPSSMPPYTPWVLVPKSSSAATMAPSSTCTLECMRSFHS
mmetsp:Transcript_51018/g.152590  ORF Transcript_51018/g.152590 Transcript_51018/m.152590 type:complete len:233 (-) Transcript_51018:195-893(-)